MGPAKAKWQSLETMTHLPRATPIDMDDTILSADGRPEIAWNQIAAEFADEYGPFSPQPGRLSGARLPREISGARPGPEWRLKLDEARRIVVRDGFAALAAAGHALSSDLAARLANRFTTYREEAMYVFPARMTPSTRRRRTGSNWRWRRTAPPRPSAPRSNASN